MNGSTLWKLIISALIVLVAVLYLIPFEDTPFKEYILQECNQDEAFVSLIDEAEKAYQNGDYYSTFVALRTIAKDRSIDLSQYFPHLILEAGLKNVEKRNEVLLNELLKRSKARLQPGLDLKGGVVFVFELSLDDQASEYERQEIQSSAAAMTGATTPNAAKRTVNTRM